MSFAESAATLGDSERVSGVDEQPTVTSVTVAKLAAPAIAVRRDEEKD